MISKPKVTVIISTYNQPKWLDLVIYSYTLQTEKNFEIIIADDGSTYETKLVINNYINTSSLIIYHIWQPDQGFQKTKILNRAIVASNSDYLLFTDGDCIARKDFVETHLRLRKKNYVLSGGYFKLIKTLSEDMNKNHITQQDCFNKNWLISNGQPKSFKLNKFIKSKTVASLLNRFTTTKATFDGMNTSCYKMDLVAVNGFDERMRYGGEDREVGERMKNNGVRFIQIRYSAICVHLYHERAYVNQAMFKENKIIRLETKKGKRRWTAFGINKH